MRTNNKFKRLQSTIYKNQWYFYTLARNNETNKTILLTIVPKE